MAMKEERARARGPVIKLNSALPVTEVRLNDQGQIEVELDYVTGDTTTNRQLCETVEKFDQILQSIGVSDTSREVQCDELHDQLVNRLFLASLR